MPLSNANIVVMEFHLKMLQGYLDKFKVYFDELQNKLRHDNSKEAYNELDGLLGVEHLEVDVVREIKYMNEFDDYFSVLPKLHYSSFLVTWYSLIESELKKICTICKEVLNLKEYKKVKGQSEIESIGRYLKSAGLYLDKVKWCEVDITRVIRNKVVHLGPDYDKKLKEYTAPELKKYIDEHNLMPDGKYKSLFIHYGFCQYLLNFTSSFFFGLYSEIDSLISSHSKETNE